MTSLIADKWIDIIKPDSASSRVAGRFFNDDYSQYENTLGSGDYSLYSDRSQDLFLDFETSQEEIKSAFSQSDYYGGSRATGTALEKVITEDIPKMSAGIRHVITFILGNSNGGQSVSQAAPKLKNAVDKVFAISMGDGATDDMKLIASGRSSQINVPDMDLLGEFIRDFVLVHGGCNA